MESTCNEMDFCKVAEVELVYRTKVKASLRPKITTAKEAYQLLLSSWDMDKIELVEQFKILLLNTGNKVLGINEVSTGGVDGTVADPKIIFSVALKAKASRIILAHNHPSGNLKPSAADIKFTEKIKNGGDFLEIKVFDHIIITPEGYYSFQNEGLL